MKDEWFETKHKGWPHDFDKRIAYYVHLLGEDDLLPFRKHENLPAVMAINILQTMKEDVADIKKDIHEMFMAIMKIQLMDELEEKIQLNINALMEKQGEEMAKFLWKNSLKDSPKGEDKK